MQQKTNKLKPTFKLAEDFLDLRNTDTHVLIAQMEENMKMRELPLEKQLRRLAKRH